MYDPSPLPRLVPCFCYSAPQCIENLTAETDVQNEVVDLYFVDAWMTIHSFLMICIGQNWTHETSQLRDLTFALLLTFRLGNGQDFVFHSFEPHVRATVLLPVSHSSTSISLLKAITRLLFDI